MILSRPRCSVGLTDHETQGLDMIFTHELIDDNVAILNEVRGHALPEATVA